MTFLGPGPAININASKEQLSKIGLTLAAFLLLIHFNMQKFQLDDQILKNATTHCEHIN